MSNARQTSKNVAAYIAAYLRQRPYAADSANGIARWWCGGLVPPPTFAMVELALRMLEADGKVVRVVMADGSVLWRAGPRL